MVNNMAEKAELELGLVDNLTPELKGVQDFANNVGSDVMKLKREALKELRETQIAARRVLGGIRSLYSAFGSSLDPFMNAIFNIIGSTIETLVALAVAEGSTILGIPAAAVHGAIATSIQIVTLPFILAGIDEAKEGSTRALALLDAVALFGGYI